MCLHVCVHAVRICVFDRMCVRLVCVCAKRWEIMCILSNGFAATIEISGRMTYLNVMISPASLSGTPIERGGEVEGGMEE